MLGFSPLAAAPLSALDANVVEAAASASITASAAVSAVEVKEASAGASVASSGSTAATRIAVADAGASIDSSA